MILNLGDTSTSSQHYQAKGDIETAIEGLELWQQQQHEGEKSYNIGNEEEYSTDSIEEKGYDVKGKEEYSTDIEEERGYNVESEEEDNTDSIEESSTDIEEERGYNVESEEEDSTDCDTDLEEQDDDNEEARDEGTIVDESHALFKGFDEEYGPYFQNFTSTMLFTWISKHMICECAIF